jgi:hypothetical protein
VEVVIWCGVGGQTLGAVARVVRVKKLASAA